MRVIRRYLFPSTACASLLPFVFFAAMWVRGIWVNGPGMVGWGTTPGPGKPTRFVAAAPDRRGMCFVAMSAKIMGMNRSGWFRDPSFTWNATRSPNNARFSRALGFDLWSNRGPFGTMVVVTLPYWFLVVMTGVLPGWYAATEPARRRRLRSRIGLCARCGYDLRASAAAGRCPECGSTIAAGAFEVRLVTPAGATTSHA